MVAAPISCQVCLGTAYHVRYTASTGTQAALATSVDSALAYTEFEGSDRPKEVARVSFRIDETFSSDLLSNTSSTFRALVARLNAALAVEFGSTPGEQQLEVTAFWSGSIGVTAVLTTQGGPPLQGVVNQLKEAVEAGMLDNIPMKVNPCSFACLLLG